MNMSYCRFENTLRDLLDCEEHFDETEDLSRYEVAARREMIEVCKRIAESYGENEEE